jgi:magnesium-transporting ATPase (P-type)
MGRSGTDVAREAADLVIVDDNFATIVAGIEQGRIAYDNVRKVIYFSISTGAAELVVMGAAAFTGAAFLPLLPVQLLWLNLVTNGIQNVALAFEPGEEGVIKRPPRDPFESIFDRLMIERTLVASIAIGIGGFIAFSWSLSESVAEADVLGARNLLLLILVLFENVHIGNCRSETVSALRLSPLKSPLLLVGAAVAFVIHVGAMYWPPLQDLLGLRPPTLVEWGVALAIAVAIFPVMELHKWTWRRRLARRNEARRSAAHSIE